jgi:thioredoxin 1
MKLLFFSANWCGQCKVMHPVIDELKELVEIVEYNAEVAEKEVEKYNIMSLPTFIVLKDGEEVDRIVGLTTKENLLIALEIS